MLAHRSAPSPGDHEAAFGGAGCLGSWLHDPASDRVTIPRPLARLIGLGSDGPEIRLSRSELLGGIHDEDRIRIDSVLHEAVETGLPFEAEFRPRPGTRAIRCLRLMGRSQRPPPVGRPATCGLVFDLTNARRPSGPPARRTHRQANQLAEHVIAMKGLAADLDNARLRRLLDELAVETAYELARWLGRPGEIGQA